MKRIPPMARAPLAALLLGALAVTTVLAAMPEPTLPDNAVLGAEPETLTPDQAQETCLRLDRNHDGYVSLPEIGASHVDSRTFQAADVNHDGRLDMRECEHVLRTS